MSAIAFCPDREELQRFLLGEVISPELEAIERHLMQCASCLASIPGIEAEDALVAALQSQGEAVEDIPDEQVEAMICRLESLRLLVREGFAEATVAADPPVAPSGESIAEGAADGEVTAELDGLLRPPQEADELGRLGGYRILGVLGAGGMGVVLAAEDPRLGRRVALKVLRPELASHFASRQRFLREAQAAAAVEHEHIVHINEVGEARGFPFVAMPLLQGECLEARLRRAGNLPLAEVLRIGREVAEGLSAAHAHGLIHRDIKPANVWLEDRRGRVKILDFGLARPVDGQAQLTKTGVILGTPAYMAPEQARGEAVDARADLFSLGCVLYRMATGQAPFRGSTPMEIIAALALQQPESPRKLNPDVPPELSELVMRLLSKKPEDRPPSAAAVVKQIESIERPLTRPSAEEATARERPVDPGVPHRGGHGKLAWVVAGFLLAAGALAAVLAPGRLLPQRRETATAADEAGQRSPAALPAEKQLEAVAARLKEINPGFDGKLTAYIGADGVTSLRFVPDDVADLGPVCALKSLTDLNIQGEHPFRSKLTDLSPLKGMRLTAVNCNRTRVSDLSPLRGMPLRKLECCDTPVSDLSPLEGMPLADLACAVTPVADLAPLRGMRLRTLSCDATPVSDLSPLRGMPLQELRCAATRVSNLAPLRGMKLTYLDLRGTAVSDLSPLRGHPLKGLNCPSSRVSDLTPLRGMKLQFLDCRDSPISDLSLLRGMPLERLFCDYKPERDAEVLRSIQTLTVINGKPAEEFWKEQGAAGLRGDGR